jgi:transcriptional regulator with XRE-family HTH domain
VNAAEAMVNQALADELVAAYKRRRMNQRALAEATGMSPTTLQRVLAGRSEISGPTFVTLCAATGADPLRLLADALQAVGGMSRIEAELQASDDERVAPVSDTTATNDELDRRRRQREAASWTTEQLEGERGAAITDGELEQPEPEAP